MSGPNAPPINPAMIQQVLPQLLPLLQGSSSPRGSPSPMQAPATPNPMPDPSEAPPPGGQSVPTPTAPMQGPPPGAMLKSLQQRM
jgi:hypothetical protein